MHLAITGTSAERLFEALLADYNKYQPLAREVVCAAPFGITEPDHVDELSSELARRSPTAMVEAATAFALGDRDGAVAAITAGMSAFRQPAQNGKIVSSWYDGEPARAKRRARRRAELEAFKRSLGILPPAEPIIIPVPPVPLDWNRQKRRLPRPRTKRSLQAKIARYVQAGYQDAHIAQLIDRSPDYVRVVKSKLRKLGLVAPAIRSV